MDPGLRRVTLLLTRNGSLVLVPEDSHDGYPSLSGVAGLLIATFVGGLSLNVLLGVALASRSLPRAAQTVLVFANGLDCLLNVPAAAVLVSSWGALSERAPQAARALCRLSAGSGQLTAILQTVAVLVVVLEQCACVMAASSSSSSSLAFSLPAAAEGGSKRLGSARGLGSAAAWTALCLAVPLAASLALPVFTSAQVRFFPTRYACGLVQPGSEALAVAVLAAGYLLPWTGMALALALAARAAQRQRWRRRQLEVAALQQGRPGANPDLELGAGAAGARSLAVLLLFMYAAMLLPGILSVQVFQVSARHRLSGPGSSPLWPVTTGTYETVFVWLRMQFAVVCPGVIVFFSRDVRQKVLELLRCVCCCALRGPCACRGRGRGRGRGGSRGNAVGHGDPWARLRQDAPASTPAPAATQALVSPSTPVLFATSQGLHLRTLGLAPGLGLGLGPGAADAEDTDDVSTSLRSGRAAPLGAPPSPLDPQPQYVFQFCDLAVVEDPSSARISPDASLGSTAQVGAGLQASLARHKSIPEIQETEPSLTREELQASLGRTRSLSSSCRKNVRFASVVSEIPCAFAPLARVPEERERERRTRTLEMALVSGAVSPCSSLRVTTADTAPVSRAVRTSKL